MILFYLEITAYFKPAGNKFQFHYDLILFISIWCNRWYSNSISISLWSYSISFYCFSSCTFFFISISLWSYSITCYLVVYTSEYINFNFIMILFYSIISFCNHDSITWFQFHYDLILFLLVLVVLKLIVLFQFHYDLILLLVLLYYLFRVQCDFNFIMILFYLN